MEVEYRTCILVVEMYSSGGDLHLELPTGEKEGPTNLWEIGPHETKSVMRLNFMGREENNHTAFIRIRTNKSQENEYLILPMEVEVTKVPGIYAHAGLLDFGTLRTHDPPETLRLNLINSGLKSVHVTNIESSPPNPAIQIEFRPIKLSSDITRFTTVAFITFTASKAVSPKQWSGKIQVRTKNSNYKLTVPYSANVLHGSLIHEHNIIIIVLSFAPDSSIAPQQTRSLFSLDFHPNSTEFSFSTNIRLYTNASDFLIPLICYNGKLKLIAEIPEV
ncbi:PREDICTED: transmembrane protein 131-like [Priapulus caudatus]|uniref:Transmembrane protein 131-like n=1 Tax=Priapulus caudatus TaxID=37621 RepID=A0ABM1FBG2_PRICU|nr:PREDICTED: transmembrane protein 131-like [Priapulus caudatus]